MIGTTVHSDSDKSVVTYETLRPSSVVMGPNFSVVVLVVTSQPKPYRSKFIEPKCLVVMITLFLAIFMEFCCFLSTKTTPCTSLDETPPFWKAGSYRSEVKCGLLRAD